MDAVVIRVHPEGRGRCHGARRAHRAGELAVRRAHKYGAVATEVDGIRFASKKEAARYVELKMLEKAGEIDGLQLQPRFHLAVPNDHGHYPTQDASDDVNKWCVGHYVADFAYNDKRSHKWVVEDVKGFKTPLYKWKKKHVEAQYGIEIREV